VARIRTVKPEYAKHRKVRRISRDARLLNIHLWNLADDEGRLQELPRWIIGEVFPADDDVTPEVLRGWLAELESVGLITRYEIDGELYIACHDWADHQKISHPTASVLPPPPSANGRGKPPGVLTEASGSPHGGKGMEGNGMEGKDEFEDWLEHYNATTDSRATGSKAARGAFNARRREGRSLDDLKLATVGCHSDAYNREHGHDVPETILRESKVERYIRLGRKAAAKRDGLEELAAREAA
jgi:hypothetical protein